jgi:Platelet-activating factor acetylhydrolase, isoform II
MYGVPPPASGIVGAIGDAATDPARTEFFAGSGQRVVPFQILYPAFVPGNAARYVPDVEPVLAAIERNQGQRVGRALARIGSVAAPWTEGARPRTNGPFPVVIYMPGVTGYMQMSSFQTAALAADGFVVVTLNGLVTVWFRSLVSHYATLASKAKGLMPPRYEWRRRAL